jgi:hypothetical protein
LGAKHEIGRISSLSPGTDGRPAATVLRGGSAVSLNGHNWTANQWNYDEVPGGASGAWTDNGTC